MFKHPELSFTGSSDDFLLQYFVIFL